MSRGHSRTPRSHLPSLQVYKGGEELMVNDVVHVVGILSLSPGVDDQDGEDGDGMQGITGPSAARLVRHKGEAFGAHFACTAWLMHLPPGCW